MALASNALTSLASLNAYMRNQAPIDADLMSIYHDESDSATAATVEVTAGAIVLVIAGGSNAGTDTLPFSSNTTIDAMVTAIKALGEGWQIVALGSGGEFTSGLNGATATSAFGLTNEQLLRGADTFMQEQAINDASAAIELFCGRTFASATYKHLFHGTGTARLNLRQAPVTNVLRVAVDFTQALTVTNSSSDARSATVSNDGTSLTFIVTGGSNADTGSTVTLAASTVSSLVTSIIAIGNGWSATSAGSTQDSWPGTELLKHSHYEALDNEVALLVPDFFDDSYIVNKSAGILTRNFPQQRGRMFRGFWHGHNSTRPYVGHNPGSHIGGHWHRGNFNIFVHYTAGFATTPLNLEMTCNKLAANTIREGDRDGTLTSLSSSEITESYGEDGAFTKKIKKDLAKFRIRPTPEFIDA